mmetsp:Transcript_20365/g.29245  ORF Transcript_20365/g.29245 Transcript_20365/m.29245 type:complete len:231 (-) Transcript_20365:998-1690(-)
MFHTLISIRKISAGNMRLYHKMINQIRSYTIAINHVEMIWVMRSLVSSMIVRRTHLSSWLTRPRLRRRGNTTSVHTDMVDVWVVLVDVVEEGPPLKPLVVQEGASSSNNSVVELDEVQAKDEEVGNVVKKLIAMLRSLFAVIGIVLRKLTLVSCRSSRQTNHQCKTCVGVANWIDMMKLLIRSHPRHQGLSAVCRTNYFTALLLQMIRSLKNLLLRVWVMFSPLMPSFPS